MTKIGLFGSSFNPPQIGHYSVIKDLADQGIFDEIWLVPVYKHAFDKELLPFETRLDLANCLAKDVGSPNVKVSTVERDLGKTPTYTFDTVTALRTRHPDADFHMIVGSDVKNDLPKWHRIEELRHILNFHFIPRDGFEASPYPKVSSTEIRDKLRRGEAVTGLLSASVAEYVLKHGLYRV